MLAYRCDHCGTCFDHPVTLRHRELLGEFIREYTEEVCPICCGDSFSPGKPCPKCGEFMPEDEILCRACRRLLKARFTDFADTLTAEEEAQLDDWLDGDTITNRRSWR